MHDRVNHPFSHSVLEAGNTDDSCPILVDENDRSSGLGLLSFPLLESREMSIVIALVLWRW